MKRSGCSPTWLAHCLKVSATSVSRWMNGTRTPPLETVRKIAGVLGCCTAELVGYETTVFKSSGEYVFVIEAIKNAGYAWSVEQKINIMNALLGWDEENNEEENNNGESE